jgi:hypothetical protein
VSKNPFEMKRLPFSTASNVCSGYRYRVMF